MGNLAQFLPLGIGILSGMTLGLIVFIQRERRRRENRRRDKLTAKVNAQLRQAGLPVKGEMTVTQLGARVVQVQKVNVESGNLETVYPKVATDGVAGMGDRQSKLDKPHLATINGLPDPKAMRAIWDEYSPETAQHIATHLPEAYAACDDPAKWGPTLIAPFVSLKRETVSRYMSAWRKAKLTELNGIPLSKE
jgi:hypothetical protein